MYVVIATTIDNSDITPCPVVKEVKPFDSLLKAEEYIASAQEDTVGLPTMFYTVAEV